METARKIETPLASETEQPVLTLADNGLLSPAVANAPADEAPAPQTSSRAPEDTDARELPVRSCEGPRNILLGVLLGYGSLLITNATYQIPGAAHAHVAAWGVVLYGAILFFRGVFQTAAGR